LLASALSDKPIPPWQQLTSSAVQSAQHGKFDEAITACLKAIDMENHYSSHHLLSQIYLAQARHDDALRHMKKAAELEPDSGLLKAGVKFHESVWAHQKGDYAGAHALLTDAVALAETHDSDVQTMEKIAIAAASLGDIPLTVTYLKKLWAIVPAFEFHNNLPFVRIVDLYEDQQAAARDEGGDDAVAGLNKDLANITKITDKVFFEISLGPETAKRVEIGLYGLAAPRAVKNMVTMAECTMEGLCYKGCPFHRIIKDFIVQGGDVARRDGTGTANIYGRPYADEVYALALMHDRPGVVQMANSGVDSNGGQFVIMAGAAPHLNGNHVVVGRVLSGLEYVIEASKVSTNNVTNKPNIDVVISNSGRVV